jgi:hypothetical protein
MATKEVLPMTTVYRGGYSQTPTEAEDLDGFQQLAMYINVANFTAGGGSLAVRVAHSLRNRAADYTELDSWTGITSANSTYWYFTEFYRYVKVKAEWTNGGTTSEADVEVLAVPKR